MSNQPQHPSSEELSAFTLGQLPRQKAEEVEAHISKCDPCCDTMMALDADEDTFVGLLKEVGTGAHLSTGTSPERAAKSDDDFPEPLLNHSRYEIEQLVGHGGMGRVFKARHRMMDRPVALKVIHREYVRRQEAIDRFRREVKTAASLDHPNIVTAHDAEHVDDLHLLVMEYVDGVDLSKTVKERGPLPVAEACDYIRQAARGLQYAHDRGMVHRDIKPHNLIVTTDGTLKILDFGLASLAPQPTHEEPLSEDADGNLTAAGSIMGTPDFISPEQARDARRVDGRSDIYSLGMTLYFLLAGRVPFSEGSVTDKLKLHAEANPAKLEGLRSDIPDGVQKIFDRMTAKDPADRFQSPQEVVDALQDCFGEPPTADSGSSIGAGGFFWWFVVAGVVLIGALGLVTYQNPDLLAWRFASESDVYAPVSELESYLASMAASPHNLVFMNLSELGPDKIGLSFKASKDGVLMHINVSSEPRGNRPRGKYANQMKKIAETLSVPVTEEANIEKDGSVSGVRFFFRLSGEPSLIAKNAQQIVTKGLGLNAEADGRFQCRNFPDHLVRGDNYEARLVDSDEFVAEYQAGERVYLGENEQHIFLVPKDRENELPLKMDDDVWYIDIRELPSGFASKVRSQAAERWHLARLSTESSENGTVEAKPELRLSHKTVNGGGGLPKMHNWNFNGRNVGEWKIGLWLAQNGEAKVIQQYEFEELPPEFSNQIRLHVKDAVGADDQRTVTAILHVECPSGSRCTTTNEDNGLSVKLEAPFNAGLEQTDLRLVRPGEEKLLYAHGYWKGDMTHGTSRESMTEATKEGSVIFVFVTLEWQAAGDPGSSSPTDSDAQTSGADIQAVD